MKKIIIFFISMFLMLIVLPTAIVFVASDDKTVQEEKQSSVTVKVKTSNGVEEFELEEYLFGVVTGEMPASFHEEALKAQTVAARTYIINKMKSGDKSHPEADVCTDPTHCKAYLSDEEIAQKLGDDWVKNYGEKVRNAVKSTENEILVYNGEPIQAVFHSTGNGKTENAVDVWGNAVPYLVCADSPGDTLSPKYSADITVSKATVAEKVMQERNKQIDVYVGEISCNESGSVATADIGGEIFGGTEIRKMFDLPSTTFTVDNAGENLVFHTRGKGHGVGMSQYGAEYYAQNGMKYDEILSTYYKGAEIEKYGEKDDKSN